MAESIPLFDGSLYMILITTNYKLLSQAGHKARDTFEYAIRHDSLQGSTFGVGDRQSFRLRVFGLTIVQQ